MWQDQPTDTGNWSEEDWERFFQQQDEQFFQKMREEMQDEPFDAGPLDLETDLDEDMARFLEEDLLSEDFDAPPEEHDCCPYEQEYEEQADFEASLGRELNLIPAWRAAVEFSNAVFEYVRPVCRNGHEGGPVQYLVRTLCQGSVLVPDYVSAGHEIGYDEDTLCGNIALCVRAKRSLDRCVQCLERLGGPHDKDIRPLLVRAVVTRTFLEHRIRELRQRVWWR